MRTSLLFASLLALGACSEPEPSDGGEGGSTSADAPKILSISTNLNTLHENEQLVITAVVTDPDGISDVIGGKLSTADEAFAYGAFAIDASEGAYSASLSWASIHATEAINTEMDMAISRTFRATFFDADGNSTYRDVTISLQCREDETASCDGKCESMNSYTYCGSCDHKCPSSAISYGCDLAGGAICKAKTFTYESVSCASVCKTPYPKCYSATATFWVSGGSDFDKPIGCSEVPPGNLMNGTQNAYYRNVTCICGDI